MCIRLRLLARYCSKGVVICTLRACSRQWQPEIAGYSLPGTQSYVWTLCRKDIRTAATPTSTTEQHNRVTCQVAWWQPLAPPGVPVQRHPPEHTEYAASWAACCRGGTFATCPAPESATATATTFGPTAYLTTTSTDTAAAAAAWNLCTSIG
jgi:hypothetical protein